MSKLQKIASFHQRDIFIFMWHIGNENEQSTRLNGTISLRTSKRDTRLDARAQKKV